MTLALFFHPQIPDTGNLCWLLPETHKHVVQVLRMQVGSPIALTDGNGNLAEGIIQQADKKKCAVLIQTVKHFTPAPFALHLAMAFTKNTGRNEWLLEKACELGVASIIPIICTRSEKENFRFDRWQNILVSAILQSQQYYLPKLYQPMQLASLQETFKDVPQKLIAHCIESMPRTKISEMLKPATNTLILIGPEGDFTPDEVSSCINQQFISVQLGMQRLRTETAALEVCSWFNILNYA
jgi:16S rRNA (uracil1498-N3)-methyltransferase